MKLHLGTASKSVYGNDTSVYWAFQLSMLKKNIPGVTALTYTASQKVPLVAGRNEIARNFMDGGSEVLCSLDNDIIAPHNGIELLLPHLDKYHIVSGLYLENTGTNMPVAYTKCQQHPDGYPVWERLRSWKGELIEVEAVGMGFCLIKREVFEKLEPPYFEWQLDETQGYRRPTEKGYLSIGEDLTFCKKVRDAGMKIAVDTSILCQHIGLNIPITPEKSRSLS